MNNIDYFFSRLIRFSILFFILYLIFTNFGTFLIIVTVIILLIYFFIYKKIKNIKEQAKTQGFEFHFDGRNFGQGSNQGFKFNYEDFQNGNFKAQPSMSEVQKAKDFFGFTSEPTKEEIKKRYKELAKKYHPDINDHGDELMQELNHYKDVLLNIYK
ncbi:J domain-containing protein [Arcobacter sp.]|uniref:J domain-containing protein n=1 Tax=Arcobacter sp. TaxID=1872629 RepID=UPI003D0F433A